jgi:hypothetical protein
MNDNLSHLTLSDDEETIQLYPIENLFPILDENDQLPDPNNNILQTPKSVHARPLSLYEWNETQAAYIWVQTYLKTTNPAYVPIPLSISYNELWWILQCFLQMVSSVRMVHHVNPSACQEHINLFTKITRARKVNEFLHWYEMTLDTIAHSRLRYLMGLFERCANGSQPSSA